MNLAFQFKTQCESSDLKLRHCLEQMQLQANPGIANFNKREDFNETIIEQANNLPSTDVITIVAPNPLPEPMPEHTIPILEVLTPMDAENEICKAELQTLQNVQLDATTSLQGLNKSLNEDLDIKVSY